MQGKDREFTSMRIAYKRGVAWSLANPGADSGLVEKAAYDYADKETSKVGEGSGLKDFLANRSAWRHSLVLSKQLVASRGEDTSYWDSQIEAFDAFSKTVVSYLRST